MALKSLTSVFRFRLAISGESPRQLVRSDPHVPTARSLVGCYVNLSSIMKIYQRLFHFIFDFQQLIFDYFNLSTILQNSSKIYISGKLHIIQK
ncbi:hypothetical protein [Metabacillus schmidteae]|uniref:hypothetical protein n=1 Tax=Metabacillus schmidteae TaxID=2730405 RepID=UPI00158AB98C|nr:hypothetical protein [Metabacillus schmidteae]